MRTRLLAIAALSLALAASTATVASATTQPSATDAAVSSAIDALRDTGTLTPGQRAALVSRPELAATILDPDPASVNSGVDSLPPAATSAVCGAWRDAWVRHRTLTGHTAWKFHQYIRWCWDRHNVTKVESRRAYVSDVDPNFAYRGLSTDDWNRPPAGEVDSFMQGKIENCIIKYGCIGTSYPIVEIHAGNDGSSYYTVG